MEKLCYISSCLPNVSLAFALFPSQVQSLFPNRSPLIPMESYRLQTPTP